METKLSNALKGKNESAGGLNIKEFRQALIKLNPTQEALINTYGRKELEIYFRADGKAPKQISGGSGSIGGSGGNNSSSSNGNSDNSNIPIASMISEKKYIIGHYINWNYSGKNIKRFILDYPILIKIDVAPFKPPAKWTKINADGYYGADKMEQINKKISETKSLIDEPMQNNSANYANITNILEYYRNLKYILKKEYKLEYCTNAWLKMVEMHNYLPLVGQVEDELKHFANAELPGAFIKGTEYFMNCDYPNKRYNWLASSLVPIGDNKNTDALDDQYGLWRLNRRKWIMRVSARPGDVDNGDTTKVQNIHYMAESIKNYWHNLADLYTSDAGISTGFGEHGDLAFNEQEQLNMSINLGQILAMLETIKVGGNFITKQYTFFKPFTYSLMVIVASMFDTFYLTKPLTSKPTNSETYLAGIGFRGISAEWKKYLEDALADTQNIVPMPGPLIPAELLDKNAVDILVDSATEIYDMQGDLVKSNVELYNTFAKIPNVLADIVSKNRNELEQTWIKNNNINKHRDIKQIK
jgi:23S rRNA U2552 (ribose-2'-O)-methylase RlmE/FtsJ